MSAVCLDGDSQRGVSIQDGGRAFRQFRFEQKVPIPAYLLALAVGCLEFRELSARCRVWSEPSVVDAAADDFSETEEFLQLAEEIMDLPYPWGRYDMLVLPPSSPYGGEHTHTHIYIYRYVYVFLSFPPP